MVRSCGGDPDCALLALVVRRSPVYWTGPGLILSIPGLDVSLFHRARWYVGGCQLSRAAEEESCEP